MKRLCLPLLVLCLLLSGCGERAAKKEFEDFSQELAAREALSFRAALNFQYEDRSLDFSLGYARDSQGETVTVIEPEIISGLRARLSPKGDTLEYEGLILDTGAPGTGPSPMSALPLLVRALCSGHLESCRREQDMSVWELIPEDGTSVSVWLEEGPLVPVKAEIYLEGRLWASCLIENWK